MAGLRTILIVDDELDIASSLEMVFSMENYKVRIASNGKQALERLAERPCPDVILSDVMMPVMDGYKFVKECKMNSEWRHIPIILASAGRIDVAQVNGGDVQVFLRKPFDLIELLSLVDQTIKEGRRAKP